MGRLLAFVENAHHYLARKVRYTDIFSICGAVSCLVNFFFCTSLSSVTIPDSVINIYPGAFDNTSLLKVVHVKSATLPFLLDDNFSGARDGGTLYVPQGSLSAYKATLEWKNFKNIVEE